MLATGGYLTETSEQSADQIALEFIEQHHDDFGLAEKQLGDLEVMKSYRTAHNGAHHVTVGQRVDGLRVHGALLTATVDKLGRLVHIGGSLASGKSDGAVNLTARNALDRAAAQAGAQPKRALTEANNRSKGKQTFANVYARGLHKPAPATAELVLVPVNNGSKLARAWYTDVEIGSGRWYETVVDADNGAVLQRSNRYQNAGPEGTVFRTQHPDSPGATREVTPFSGLDGSWVTDRVTSGNNVNAYRDLQNDNSVGYQPQTPDSGDPDYQHFNYAFTNDWRSDADGDDESLNADLDAIETQLFYYTNVMHDYLYGLGFDEASGNFQVDNFGRGGDDGDPVLAEAQDGWDFGCVNDDNDPIRCQNNANFGTPSDGNSPRMQMYMWAPPNRPYRDGSLDGDVIAHEYGHGVSNRLVGGGSLGGGVQTGALGEGWSDTISFLKWGDATVGEYVTGNFTRGIRSTAYDVSTEGYGSFDAGRGVHRNGEVWAATMYDIRELKDIPYTQQLVIDGMKNTSSSPSYLDARDGILAADLTNTGGANQCLLWRVFAGRGMGVAATSSGDQQTVDDDNTIPVACRPTADAGGPYVTAEGTNVTLDGSGSTPASDPSGGALSYAWDLDDDGQFDDATGVNPTFDRVGQDGSFTVRLQVTDQAGNTATDSASVQVTNVAPVVVFAHDGPKPEGGTVKVTGTITDPGWLDPLTATVNWGDGAVALPGSVENDRPNATLTFEATHVYGDNGTFPLEICGTDDDVTTCLSTNVAVTNVAPTAAIDKSGAVDAAGGKTVVAHKGDDVELTGRATDPGSDDLTLTWDFRDGAPSPDRTVVSLVNPPNADPPLSPSVQPRDVSDSVTRTYGRACLYDVDFAALDDDGGKGTDTVKVVVQGNGKVPAIATLWYTAYLVGSLPPDHLPDDTLNCYLQVVQHMSGVLSELRDVSTIPKARQALAITLLDPKRAFDRQLFAAWLNFAHGSFDLNEQVDTNCNLSPDATFFQVVKNAESVRLNPASTNAQLVQQAGILERMNLCNTL